MIAWFTTLLLFATADGRCAESFLNHPDRAWKVGIDAELGLLAPLAHSVILSKDGTRFDYVDEGGQDNLFPFWRMSAELRLHQTHILRFLYQPLDLRTKVVLRRDERFDGLTFPSGTPLDVRYGFSFWRMSYLYDFLPAEKNELSLGVSLQIRNATLDFTSADGRLRRSNRDVGPVPLIKIRGRTQPWQSVWVGAEVDGFYAPVKYINGSDSDVEGAIIDASLRAGVEASNGISPYLNLRYLGGGAKGTSRGDAGPGDGYSSNWLHFVTVSVGVFVM